MIASRTICRTSRAHLSRGERIHYRPQHSQSAKAASSSRYPETGARQSAGFSGIEQRHHVERRGAY
jgi:hypothetical protein